MQMQSYWKIYEITKKHLIVDEKWKFDKMYYRGEKLLGGYSLYVVITKEVDDGNSTVSMLIRAPKNIPAGK